MRNKSPVRPARRVRGFTIIESLIAGVILALFAAALAGATAQSSRAAARAQDHRKAAEWLDTVFTRFDILGPARLAAEGPVAGPLDERFHWSATITEDDVWPDLYQVSVIIRYTTLDGRPGRVVGHTQMHDPVGRRVTSARWGDL
ncbi:MAG: prepilin-type N-terminal cleavage/methylation domain-containing protein [Planctomycetota bacterium]